jgi:hypothetical protein
LGKRLQVQKKAVPLHPQSRNDGYSKKPQGSERENVTVAKQTKKKSSLKDL